MRIEKRTMNWLPRPSAYDEAMSQRAKRRAASEDFISSQTNLANAFSSTQTDAVTQMGDIVSRMAQARISDASAAQAEAQQQKLQALLDTSA